MNVISVSVPEATSGSASSDRHPVVVSVIQADNTANVPNGYCLKGLTVIIHTSRGPQRIRQWGADEVG